MGPGDGCLGKAILATNQVGGRGRTRLFAALLAGLVAAALSPALRAHPGDSDGDGKDDLAIGVPNEDIESVVADAGGAVNVLFGASSGIVVTDDLLFSQETVGISDTAESLDTFGRALAWGDFDGDGFDDLAIGVPGENSNA